MSSTVMLDADFDPNHPQVRTAELTQELVAMSDACATLGEERACFLTPDGRPVRRVREIGEILFALGGLELMRQVHARVRILITVSNLKHLTDASELESAWGVGGWRR